jgi:hypothetical protein
LALAGYKSLEAPVLTDPERRRMVDLDHYLVHLRLARLYELQGNVGEAINCYRLVTARGRDGVYPRVRLAWLYLKQGMISRARGEAWQGLKRLPADVREKVETLAANLGRRIFLWWFKQR